MNKPFIFSARDLINARKELELYKIAFALSCGEGTGSDSVEKWEDYFLEKAQKKLEESEKQ